MHADSHGAAREMLSPDSARLGYQHRCTARHRAATPRPHGRSNRLALALARVSWHTVSLRLALALARFGWHTVSLRLALAPARFGWHTISLRLALALALFGWHVVSLRLALALARFGWHTLSLRLAPARFGSRGSRPCYQPGASRRWLRRARACPVRRRSGTRRRRLRLF